MASSADSTTLSARGGRGRGGFDGQRGGRGRGTDRGRGASRGFRGGSNTNEPRSSLGDKGATESGFDAAHNTTASDGMAAWDTPVATGDTMESSWDQPTQPSATSPDTSSWEMVTPAEVNPAPAVESLMPSSKPDGTRSWASIFNKPTPSPVRSKVPQVAPSQDHVPETLLAPEVERVQVDEPGLPPPVSLEESVPETPDIPSSPGLPTSEQAVNITPSKDELTETNLEQVLDVSAPPATATAASTVATTHDPRSGLDNNTPSLAKQAALRPSLGGFATSAYKATAGSGRSASFQRRVLEQHEAVVMPENHTLDRTAVQFGRMGLNDASEDLDVDDDREDAETRTQPPQHSPVAPKATLPPARQTSTSDPIPIPTPRQAPGLPPVAQQSQQPFAQQPSQPAETEQGLPQPSVPSTYPYNQFNNRFAPSISQPEAPAPAQKAYEPFGQQIQQPHVQQNQYDGYQAHSQTSSQPQQQSQQSQLAGYSSAAHDYSSYYTSDNQRNAYQNFYGNYGQPGQQTQQDAGISQQRTGSAFGSTGADQASQYATTQSQQPPQARYGQIADAHTSGHSTPNPVLPSQQVHAQGQQAHHMAQQHAQSQAGGQHGAYPYGHPYYNSPYYSAYQVSHNHSYGRDRPMFDDVRRYDDQYLTHNQFGYGGNQGGYGSGPYAGVGGKQAMYGQPHQGYGMSPQTSYEHHSASPANAGGYGQQQHSMPGRDGALGGGLGAYGRSGSAQPPESQPQHTSSAGAFGSMPDVFARSQSGFPGQNQGIGQQAGGPGGNDEAGRGYGDSTKVSGGPSPGTTQSAGRPGSAANNMQGQAVPPSQNQSQQGYGGYPAQMAHQMHGQQGSQYGAGLGGLGAHHQTGAQAHQAGGYGAGGYGAGFGGSYYGNNNRGGWSGNYGH